MLPKLRYRAALIFEAEPGCAAQSVQIGWFDGTQVTLGGDVQAHRLGHAWGKARREKLGTANFMTRIDAQRLGRMTRVVHQLADIVQQRCGDQRGRAAVAAAQFCDLQSVLQLRRILAIALRPEAPEEAEDLVDDGGCHWQGIGWSIGLYQFPGKRTAAGNFEDRSLRHMVGQAKPPFQAQAFARRTYCL